jgi:protocatechuate 3,4-dioxygenase beta subunit
MGVANRLVGGLSMRVGRVGVALGIILSASFVPEGVQAQAGKNALEEEPERIPGTIPVEVSGRARDEDGQPVRGARVFLLSAGIGERRLVGQATTDADGRYRFTGARMPVVRESPGRFALPPGVTPYADFVVCGTAPGLGLAWSRPRSMYALATPDPDDIQGRLPLGPPVFVHLDFARAASLKGRVVDDDGQPVAGARVQVLGASLLDETGQETNDAMNDVWEALPDSIGAALTDQAGRFAMDRLPDRACLRLAVIHPEIASTRRMTHAATIEAPDTVHDRSPPGSFHAWRPHPALAGDIVITFPRLRRVVVSVVGDDTHRPVAGARVVTIDDDPQAGLTSSAETGHDGNAVLGLPPGRHAGVYVEPPIATHYLRAELRPLVVGRGDDRPCTLALPAGCDLRFRVTEAGTNRPRAGVYFWKFPADHPDQIEIIRSNTDRADVLVTDQSGLARVVLPPEPGKRYRFRVASVGLSRVVRENDLAAGRRLRYSSDPDESRPVELAAAKSVRLWFVLPGPGVVVAPGPN